MKLTQHELIMDYVRLNGSIIPAKSGGLVHLGVMFGSEVGRRCRELRNEGKLRSDQFGKFERYYLPGDVMSKQDSYQKMANLFPK